LIRIFSTKDGTKLKEVRRGADNAKIFSIAFNKLSTLIAVCSDKGTCHLYNLETEEKKVENKTSWFSSLGKVVSYFGSEWSFASYKFTDLDNAPITKCAFVGENNLVLISILGDYYLFEINIESKEMILKEKTKILEIDKSGAGAITAT